MVHDYFAIQLVVCALREFTESGVAPGIDNAWWHSVTEDLAEGLIAQMMSLALVIVPTVWLALAQWQDRGNNSKSLGTAVFS